MNSLLQNTPYVLDPSTHLWSRPGYGGIAYSDGTETELRISDIVTGAKDRSVLSTELRSACTDWPTLYHLSGTRANVLRPFTHLIKGDVLEVGAGCGAITRFLGESGANVLALEGSPRRAGIARARTADLANVSVLTERFESLECHRQFDVITLIGVLEYANLFTKSDTPALAMLRQIRSLLKPNGRVIIAIENQLGLKYFAGAPEDHLGRPMYGIEGRYQPNEPQTFGKKVLDQIIRDAGFSNTEFLAPFPDYKLPSSVVTERGINDPRFDAAAFGWQNARRDPQLPQQSGFSIELAWPAIFANGIAMDMANSFIVVASPDDIELRGTDANVLAYHYSTDRVAEYCKVTKFKPADDGSIDVIYERLGLSTPDGNDPTTLIRFCCPERDNYRPGKSMSWEFIQLITRDNWTLADVRNFLVRYIGCLETLLAQQGRAARLDSPNAKLPGSFFDLTPQNLILGVDRSATVIDTEWILRDDITLGHLLFRGLLWMLGAVTRFGVHHQALTRERFIRESLHALGFDVDAATLTGYLNAEATIQSLVTGRQTLEFLQFWKEQPLPMRDVQRVISEQQAEIARLSTKLHDVEWQRQIEHSQLVQRIDDMHRSTSWRVTRPLRVGVRVARGEYKLNDAPPVRKARRRIAQARAIVRAVPRAVSFYDGSPLMATRRIAGVVKREGLKGVIRRARILAQGALTPGFTLADAPGGLYGEYPMADLQYAPKVSVIVPNFNHAKYLPERLDSIYQQSYGNYEVILLDDCSTDNSIEVLESYARRYPSNTVCAFNQVNSGSVFNQWKKGLELATGELVWIAESDDFCSPNLLAELVRSFQNPGVMLSFARSEFVRGTPPVKIWSSDEYLADLNLGIWNSPFIKSAHELMKSGWVVKNLVPNASGAIFRHPGKLPLLDDPRWRELRMCGDWVFYASIIRGGLVGYTPTAVNYYRQHASNTSVNTQKQELYYREHKVVIEYLAKLYKLDRNDFERQRAHLYQHWVASRGLEREREFDALYAFDDALAYATERKPNLVMAVYALTAGGGETFPISLANFFHDRGYAVTVLNFRERPTEPGVRRMLSQGVPLLELEHTDWLAYAFRDMGIELVHSHHAWVDVTLATALFNEDRIKQVVSMHGMYEMMTAAQINALMPLLERRISRFVFTAEKNLPPFPSDFQSRKGFSKIDNALAITQISPVPRSDLGIDDGDFVLCLVARAIPDKGWAEAIESTVWANAHSDRKIHLILIGEGPEYDRLKDATSHDFLHFLGFRSNIRDYFAMADMGFLPSKFKGESFPLVLIDCLHSGRPFLASNIGEIKEMLATEQGLAGQLFDLENWQVPVEMLGEMIVELARPDGQYTTLLARVSLAALKFDPEVMVEKYDNVYRTALAQTT